MKKSKYCFLINFLILSFLFGCTPREKEIGSYRGVEQVRPLEEKGELVRIIPREDWTNEGPMLFGINPMKHIYRMTIHHTAMQGDDQPDPSESSKLRLQKILYLHKHKNYWADIGYHYLIDRAGVIWEGRNIKYQGAHAQGANNDGNIGIALIGNFELYQPTFAQKTSLKALVSFLCDKYQIRRSEIYPHKHFRETQCPGANMLPFVNELRNIR